MEGRIVDSPKQNFWERFYRTHLPRIDHLPEGRQGLWFYLKLWPNMAFERWCQTVFPSNSTHGE